MEYLKELKESKRPKIGLYTIGLKAYWDQFHGIKERLIEYGRFLELKMSEDAEVFYYGLVDDEIEGRKAGEWFNEKNVDLIFCHSATYALSSSILPIHQICKSPVVILNLQPTARINYDETTTGEWLAHCGSCPIPEIANTFNRGDIKFRVINGLLGLDYTPEISKANENTSDRKEAKNAWKEIKEWIGAAAVKRTLQHSRFGFLGGNYSGMLDMYSDFTMLQSQAGIHVELLEMCDLDKYLNGVTEEEINIKRAEIEKVFKISGDSPSDPIAKKPTEEQMQWCCKVAVAQEKMVKDYDLDGLAYYYHGAIDNNYEKLQSGFIVGHSLLTAKGIPCAGEGDLKTAIAMKICDILGLGGSFSEIISVDYIDETILLGHDGPFHIKISDGNAILRGMGLYHGKKGNGVSVEAKVKRGEITTLGLTQTIDGKLKLIISEGESTNGETMKIGNTQTHIKFNKHPDEYMHQWFNEAPTHHCSMSIGHNANVFKKVADLLNINKIII